MTRDEIVETVGDILNRIIVEKGLDRHRIDAETVILGGDIPIDSLDLATIVVEMESRTGKDPFKLGFIYFNTVGELADLYT